MLAGDRATGKRDLGIQRYAVIPLSNNAGVVGWVPHCDTIHSLIKEYREARKIPVNIEHALMLQMASPRRPPETRDLEALTVMQKLEVFEYALANTTGQDLAKVLWLKSATSEEWLERRTKYTRSLAVMSMVRGLGGG